MKKYHRLATMDDVYFVAKHMRVEDVEECEAGGLTALDALTLSYKHSSVCYALVTDAGESVALVGVCLTPNPHFGLIWLLGTPLIKTHAYVFLRNCKEVLASLYDETGCEVLYNYTYVKNRYHHKWLRWLGFTFLRTIPYGPHGAQFIEFAKIKG